MIECSSRRASLIVSIVFTLAPVVAGLCPAAQAASPSTSSLHRTGRSAALAGRAAGKQAFSQLTVAEQAAVRRNVAPPPIARRHNPYSTPMYYPMWGEIGAENKADFPQFGQGTPDGKFHPEWQEALIKDWAELGMTKLHFYLFPKGVGSAHRDYTLDDSSRVGIREFVRLCKQYGIRVGLRVDLPYGPQTSQQPVDYYWIGHPDNPENELKPYFGWLQSVVHLMRGELDYIVLGDEIDWTNRHDGKDWNQDVYMRVFRQASEVVRKEDPRVKISMYAVSSGKWHEVMDMLKAGYSRYGDAVTINSAHYADALKLKADVAALSPDKKLPILSNGVGYIAANTDRNPASEHRYTVYSDREQAALIARTMYTWWALDAEVAPYYVCMRNTVYHGVRAPYWYGFFGFMDFVVDDNDNASVHRYDGWYAYHTVATVFHDRPSFTEAKATVTVDGRQPDYIQAFERNGKELVIILWSDAASAVPINLRIDTDRYRYPVQIDLMNPDRWTDLAFGVPGSGGSSLTISGVPCGKSPTIIRLVSPSLLKQQ